MSYGACTCKSPCNLLKFLAAGPGRVAPQEEYESDKSNESDTDLGGAGLPIPEGRSSTAWPDGQDGQSHPCDC